MWYIITSMVYISINSVYNCINRKKNNNLDSKHDYINPEKRIYISNIYTDNGIQMLG